MITVVTPPAAAGGVDVIVAGPNGQSATTAADRFTFAPVCVVPNLKGKSLKSAKKLLTQANCGLGTVKGARTGKVKRQSRKPGATLAEATRVNVVLARQRRHEVRRMLDDRLASRDRAPSGTPPGERE